MRRRSTAIASVVVLVSLCGVVAAAVTSTPMLAVVLVGGALAVVTRLMWAVSSWRDRAARVDD